MALAKAALKKGAYLRLLTTTRTSVPRISTRRASSLVKEPLTDKDAGLPRPPTPPTKRGRAMLLGVLTMAGVGGCYYYYVTVVEPSSNPPLPSSPPPQQPLKPSLPPTLVEKLPPATSPLPTSPREQLLAQESKLNFELAELRKMKKDKFIDMKKKEIKDEIKIIRSGLRDIEKQFQTKS